MTHKNATARISAALPNTASAKRRIIGKRYTHKEINLIKWKQIYLRMYRDNPAWKSWWHAESPSPEILSFYLSAAIIDICKNEYFHRQSYIYCSRSQDWRREKKACQVKTLIQNIESRNLNDAPKIDWAWVDRLNSLIDMASDFQKT